MVEGKQVKVDNWGIFFLQRLHQFYNKTFFCDLTLQFEDNVQIKVHRLVMNACTEYFQMLESKCEMEKDCLMMPSNLPSDVVLPIINFMYSGILEFHESLFDRLYATAKLMNMSVLTKLLDAQKQPIKPITPVQKRVQSVTPITWNLQGKKIMTKNFSEPELPETLPGRKLPIWKRKSAPNSVSFLSSNNSNYEYPSKICKSEEPPKPTRFEWPEEDESNFENSFDEISYTSKPLILPSQTPQKDKSPRPSTSTFDEIKKSGPVKRSASPIGNQCKKVNIQDVKEYLKEHKIRSDFIDYDDSETTDNDLQTYDHDDSAEECSKDASDVFQQLSEETPSKSILKTDSSTSPSNKHVRFSLDGKDNKKAPKPKEPAVDMNKHTKIITEVLKKYPHLVKNKKNIRLKILAKGNNTPVKPITKAQVTPAKPTSKVSYMVMKPEAKSSSQPDIEKNRENGPWECNRCEEPKIFKSYHTYRQHLTEVHNEKTDSQMCILCGHISRKQNMLVYHKYVKHNVPPPAMYNFPKCKECNYIALSPALLNKHMLNHTVVSLTCQQCETVFQNKHLFYSHIQQTGHSQNKAVSPQFNCNFCDKRFFSENILNTHIKRNHEKETKVEKKEIKQEAPPKAKDKIKIISDVKVGMSVSNLVPVKVEEMSNIKQESPPEQLEPSSEAEALSNVASGIAASLGLVDTIVVLDDNQFILQSHGNIQENMLNNTGQEYIIPEMHMADLSTIANANMQVSQTVTDTSTVLTQTNTKPNITSTDELVMVLTDHDYSDAVNNTVMTDNNIVVLYSHPVQTQAMMINSETGLIEVNKNYTVQQEMTEQVVNCEESIEMIQQEINNQLEEATEQTVEYVQQDPIYVQNETNVEYQETMEVDQNTYQVTQNDVIIINNEEKIPHNTIEESIEMIQDEINKMPESEANIKQVINSQELMECQETVPQNDNQQIMTINQNTCDYIVQCGVDATQDSSGNILSSESGIEVDMYDKNEDIITPEETIVIENQQMENTVVRQETQDFNTPIQEVQQSENSVTVHTEEQHIPTEIQQLKTTEIISQDCQETEMVIEQLENQESAVIPQLENQEITETTQQQIENLETQNIIQSEEQVNENEIHQEICIENQQLDVVQQPEQIEEPQESITKEIPQQNEDISQQLAAVPQQLEEMPQQLEEMPQQLEEMPQQLEEMPQQLEEMPSQMDELPHLEEIPQQMEEIPQQMEGIPQQMEEIPQQFSETVENNQVINKKEILENLPQQEISVPVSNLEQNTEKTIQEEIDVPDQTTDTQMEIEATHELETPDDSNTKEETTKINEPEMQPTEDESPEMATLSESVPDSPESTESEKNEQKKINAALQKEKISQLLHDWDDGDTDSQQSFSKSVTPVAPNNTNSINKLIDDWEDEDET